MSIGKNIRKIRKEKNLLQKQVAIELNIGNSNYNKIENGIREITVKERQNLANLFNLTTDQIINCEEIMPKEVTVIDKSGFEQINLINKLEKEDKIIVLKIIETMLTKKKFKDFFNNNIATL